MGASSVQSLSSAGTVGSAISLFILAFVGISAFFALIFGFKRGFSKSIVRIITMAIAAVGAFLIASNIGSAVASAFGEITLLDFIKQIEATSGAFFDDPAIYDLIGSFDAETTTTILSLVVSLLIVPIAFVIVFYAFKIATLILFWLISAMLGLTRRHKGFISRILGIAIAAVQGAIIVGVVTLPIAGFAALAEEVTSNMMKSTTDAETAEAIEQFREDVVYDVLDNPVVAVILNAGGKDMFRTMTSSTIDGDRISAYDEVADLSNIFSDVKNVMSLDFKAPTDDNKKSLDNIADKISNNYFTSTVISGTLRGFAKAVDKGALTIKAEEPLSSFISDMISVFETSNQDNLEGDLKTILDVYYILADNGVLDSFDDADALRTALLSRHGEGEDAKTVIDYVVDELYKNPRTASIVNSLTEISIKIMCESMGLDEDAQEIYENVKSGVKDVLAINSADYETKEEYVAAVSVELDSALKENNIEVDEATLNNMSTYIADNYGEINAEDITDEDINKAILSYYNAYAEANPDSDININDYLQ